MNSTMTKGKPYRVQQTYRDGTFLASDYRKLKKAEFIAWASYEQNKWRMLKSEVIDLRTDTVLHVHQDLRFDAELARRAKAASA